MAACLQQLGGSPERVVNALLEGLLPAPLAALDAQLGLAAWQAAADKGKQPAAPSYDSEFPATLPGSGSGAGGVSAAASSSAAAAAAAEAAGRAGAPRAEDRTARYLDVRDASYREALVTAANAAQVRR